MTLSADMQRRLGRLADLPSPPAVAMRLVELARDPDVTIDAIAKAIECDPALSAKVLRVANSAHYARSKTCDCVRRALIMLGMQSTISTALGFSLVHSLQQERCGTLDYTRFWQRSLLAGVAARELGELVGYEDGESLFLAALLQDIGMLAIDALEPDLYAGYSGDPGRHCDIDVYEQSRLGCCHSEVGGWLLTQWNLPEHLPLAVSASHAPTTLEAGHDWGIYARCVGLAGLCADVWLTQETPAALTELVAICEKTLGMAPADTGIALARMREVAPETASIFDVRLISQAQMQKVVNDARDIILASNSAALEEASKLREALASYQSRAARS